MTPRPAPASAPPRRLTITLLGFSSGLPLALTASTLTVRLAESGVNKATIGLFAGVSLAYAFKFLGAPFVDALKLPVLTRLLGRRRSWMAVTQTALIAALLVLAQAPAAAPSFIGLCAVAVAVLSALQDIAIDAWRVERLTPEEQGMGGTYAVLGYRLGVAPFRTSPRHIPPARVREDPGGDDLFDAGHGQLHPPGLRVRSEDAGEPVGLPAHPDETVRFGAVLDDLAAAL